MEINLVLVRHAKKIRKAQPDWIWIWILILDWTVQDLVAYGFGLPRGTGPGLCLPVSQGMDFQRTGTD